MDSPSTRRADADNFSDYSPHMTSASTISDLSDVGDTGLSATVAEPSFATVTKRPAPAASTEELECHSTFYMREDMTEIRVCTEESLLSFLPCSDLPQTRSKRHCSESRVSF
jgi:hypothetical protein